MRASNTPLQIPRCFVLIFIPPLLVFSLLRLLPFSFRVPKYPRSMIDEVPFQMHPLNQIKMDPPSTKIVWPVMKSEARDASRIAIPT
jgi:hypothetical protein